MGWFYETGFYLGHNSIRGNSRTILISKTYQGEKLSKRLNGNIGLLHDFLADYLQCINKNALMDPVGVEAAGQVYSQTNYFVYLEGNVNHNADLFIDVDRRIRNA